MKEKKMHYAWVILIACCLLQIGTLGGIGYSTGIYYSPIAEELGVGRGSVALYRTLESTVSAFMSPIVGKWLPGKNMGKKMAGAMVCMMACYCMMSRYHALWQWYVTSAIMGIFSSCLYLVPVPLLINKWFHKGTGTAMGIAMCSGVGGAVMTQVGTRVIATSGWRMAYLVIGAICTVIVVPTCLLLIKFDPAEKGMTPYGAEETATEVYAAPLSSKGVPYQVAVKSKAFIVLFLAAGIMSFPSIYSSHIVSFAGTVGLSPEVGANLASVMMIASMAAKLVIGQLNDRIGARNAAVTCLTLMGAGFAAVALFPTHLAILFVAVCFCSFGPGLMSVQPSLLSKSVFGNKDHTRIFSSITISAALVSAWANTIIGVVYDVSGSYIPAFALAVVMSAAAIVLVFIFAKMGRVFSGYFEDNPSGSEKLA